MGLCFRIRTTYCTTYCSPAAEAEPAVPARCLWHHCGGACGAASGGAGGAACGASCRASCGGSGEGSEIYTGEELKDSLAPELQSISSMPELKNWLAKEILQPLFGS